MASETTNITEEFKKLPVTVLSGFLGSGKTTMLKHILENKQNLRCALIVNDMAELNIDSALIQDTQLVQSEEKMISMQNGCICCTLREDLLLEVANLAKQRKFDYLVIESTGISEPIQVAETFSFDIPQEDDEGNEKPVEYLKNYATLDCCVTVVDSYNFFTFFNTEKSLTERFPEENPAAEDERTVTELMVDQLEFANVIVLNKTDLVTKVQLEKVRQMARKLNPTAEIITTTRGKVDLTKIINTGIFDLEKAKENKDWLIQDRYNFVPETQEYGITSFVYKAKTPFHNIRIYDYLSNNFYVDFDPRHIPDDADFEEEEQQQQEEEKGQLEIKKQENPEDQGKKTDDHKGHNHRQPKKRVEDGEEMEEEEEEEEIEEEEGDWEDDGEEQDEEEQLKVQKSATKYKRLRNLAFKQKKQGNMKNVWRSKGFFWVAGNKKEFYAWQQSGIINQIFCGGIFGCMLDEKTIAEIPKEEYAEIKAKFDPVVGDRTTSIVFIGKDLDEKRIRKELDACLVTKKEFKDLVENDLELTFKDDPFFLEEEEEGEEEDEMEEEEQTDKKAVQKADDEEIQVEAK